MNWTTSTDWYGKNSPYEPRMGVELEGDFLIFSFAANKKPLFQEHHESGDFVEGLWERDVAEFFVGTANGDVYQEINVSPSGAWWSALFSDYRVREQEVRMEVEVDAELEAEKWAVRFRVPIGELVPWRDVQPGHRTFTPTAVLYDPKPHYFCWAEGQSVEPDFHLKHLRRPIKQFL